MKQARSWLTAQSGRIGWAAARAMGMLWRGIGLTGVLAVILAALIAAAMFGERWQMNRLEILRRHVAELQYPSAREMAVRAASRAASDASSGGRARLRTFEAILLPHEDIPVLLQDLLRIADEEGVTLSRGEYRAEPDTAGGFLRYRMELPLRGPAPAIYRFIARALAEQSALALRSVHFRRARIDTEDIEARIQWVVLAKMAKEGTRPTRPLSATDG